MHDGHLEKHKAFSHNLRQNNNLRQHVCAKHEEQEIKVTIKGNKYLIVSRKILEGKCLLT